ncbi:MAG TPA: hypothetical protein VJ647_04160 [Chitinophagaceae bacterium]|nr:hypothetical protein [Chitinophagaceae bacterium]
MKSIQLFFFLLLCSSLPAQKIKLLHSGNKISLRGLSVVNDRTVWVSGSNGTVGLSVDGGDTWKWMQVPGFEKKDFRDIEAFDAKTAVIMAIDTPAYILKTFNGGETWKVVYENRTQGMFLDALEFWNEQSGIVVGDPVNGRFFIARSFDGGNTWRNIPYDKLPAAEPGEACFAASGTNLRRLNLGEACFVTGGKKSRLFWKGEPVVLPVIQGTESAGANSIAIKDDKKRKSGNYFIVVGGDYTKDTLREKNCFITKDGGKTWIAPLIPPYGYRSCVEFINDKTLIACGTSGVDLSRDEGMNWSAVSSTGFHVCRKAKQGKKVFLAGSDGRIAVYEAEN